ncbi:MAG TPA: hypothetical protein VIV11_12655 [Kofleriaceae bacterium]
MSDPKDDDEPAVKSSGNMGTTADSSQAETVESTEDKPADDEASSKSVEKAADDEGADTAAADRPADKQVADEPADDKPADDKPTADKRAADNRAGRSVAEKPGAKRSLGLRARRAWQDMFGRSDPSAKGAKQEPDAWDRIAAWLIANGALPAVAAVTVAVFAIHAHIFMGETAGDDLSFHFAESARLMDCLRHFDFDLWNPSANAGYASAYYYQVLPQMASALPAAIFGHHLFWFQLSVILPLVLAPACAYKGMRLLGATPWQAAIAAFCVAFMNGDSRWGAGNAGTFVVGLYTQTWALCAFPLALGYAYQWMVHAKHLAAAIAWGAFVFLCHPFAGITLGFAVFAAWFAQLVLLPFDELFKAIAPDLPARLGWLRERWQNPPERPLLPELVRGAILAVAFVIAWMPVWLPLWIDAEGFGGFPHRVADEVGPGFKMLGLWHVDGRILDWLDPKLKLGMRLALLTWSLPVVILLARAKFYRWLWAPAFLFALLLGLGPSIGKIGDDLIPPVRFLGGMQTVLAMGIGAGAIIIGTRAWELVGRWPTKAYAIRTVIAAAAAAAIVLIVVPGSRALSVRVRVLGDHANSRAEELRIVNAILAKQPQGRKQSGPGAENHWWNLLTYVYHRVPSTLQMGGGGLQASPNYDFLWTQRDYVKNAWIFDAPYLVFMSSMGSKMPVGETVAKTMNFEVRRLPSPGLVSPVRVTGTLPPGYSHKELGHKKALEWIKSDQPMRDEVLAYVGSEGGNRDAPGGRTIRSWRQSSPGSDPDIVAEVEVERTTTFTVRESWHPRWHAYVDDEEVPVRRVTPDFIAVDVPPGKHTIAVRFERPLWAHAAWLAWPLTALIAWYVMRRRERRKSARAA